MIGKYRIFVLLLWKCLYLFRWYIIIVFIEIRVINVYKMIKKNIINLYFCNVI